MGVFMEGRLRGIACVATVAWCLGRVGPKVSWLLWAGALAWFAQYAFLLWKTVQGAVLKPLVWGWVSCLVVARDLTREEFFRADLPPEDIAAKREAALNRLQAAWRERWPKAREISGYLRKHFSDFRFKASGFESIFPIFQKVVNDALDPACIVERSGDNELIDVDGQRFLDASGSYGVNCFGLKRFKEFMIKGHELSQSLGPCLGPMHPIVAENIKMLLTIFQKEEVSFHMSGTEAVMCAVQQARFHTRRPLVAVFGGSYHGWWDGVMQGAGNERFNSDCLVLKDQSPASLELLKLRKGEIAAVIVNPIAGFGWSKASTAGLGHSKVEAGASSIDRFRIWLQKLRKVATECDIPLIFDETWAFQLGPGGAQELYNVQADLVVLGKSLGGGHATGAVCGSSRLMERRDPDRPMRVSFVVGTFKGNPVVMGSMNAVLKWVSSPEAKPVFDGLKDRVARWVETCNTALKKEALPINVAAYRSTWCICYNQPSAYQFLFQYYLRNAGLQLVWAGTSKMLLNLEYTDEDLKRLTEIILSAARQFKADGWWWEGGQPVSLPKFVIEPTLKYHWGQLLNCLGLGNGTGGAWTSPKSSASS